jgi:putative cardiolipin synthase
MKVGKSIALGIAVLVLALAGVRALNPLPTLDGRSVSAALRDTSDTGIGRSVASPVAAHAGQAGIYVLSNGRDAFATRLLLAARAERSLDVQYYIWRGDRTGTLLFDELRAAADRGVRVRLLLDDNNTADLDSWLAALDSHELIEVRLFNPFVLRRFRIIGYLSDFFRLNRRMHNKSFTADNQATIIGGRNVGDEYFDAAADTPAFVDLDALAIGAVVRDVSSDFDRYWASASAYPAERLLPPAGPGALDELRAAAAAIEREPAAANYFGTLRSSAVVAGLVEGTLPFEWAPTRIVSDDPAKGLGLAPREQLFREQLFEIIGSPERELELVSPYFVPTDAGVDSIVDLADRKVRVRILVNSLAATDVTAVHSGYARHRKPLLESGIAIYEMRLVAPSIRPAGWLGSDATSLHAKTFAVDRARVFIGSFNFDPRSANLNTELGFVIESPVLANRVATFFDETVPEVAYEVQLSAAGELYWTEREEGAIVQYDDEPGASFLRQAAVWVLALLPIESLL